MYYTRIIRIIQPTFQKTQFNKRSYNTRSCIIVHMAVYYTLYYTYVLYRRSIHTVLYSPPPGCCPQSNEILLNKGMKYWDSGFNERGARTFIATVHIEGAVIGWKLSGKERRGQTQFSTKFAAKLSFMPRWSPVYFFPLFFEISSPMWPNKGSGAVFSWFYG
jgi:hypothetical protein